MIRRRNAAGSLLGAALALPLGTGVLSSCDRADSPLSVGAADTASLQTKVDRIREEVAVLRGLPFARPVAARWVARSRLPALMDSIALASGEVQDTSGDGASEELFQALGFLDSSQSVASSTESFYDDQIAAFYVRGSDHLWVVSDQASAQDLDATIAHELTHALIDQNFGDTISASAELDAYQAYQFLHEGEANYVADLWSIQHQGVDTSSVSWPSYTSAQFLSRIARNSALSGYPQVVIWPDLTPYYCGESWARAARIQGGWAALDQAHRVHPTTTASQFRTISGLAPAIFSDWDSAGRFPSMSDRRSDGQGRLGEVYLDALMATWNAAIVSGWGGDRFWVWGAGGSHGTAVAARTNWLSESSASGFLASWSAGMAAKVGAKTVSGPDSLEFRSSDSIRVARGVRRGREVLVAWGDLRAGRLDSLWDDLGRIPSAPGFARALAPASASKSPFRPLRSRSRPWL